MAFVRSPKFYLLNGVKELVTALIETWTAVEDNSLWVNSNVIPSSAIIAGKRKSICRTEINL